jgi:hypothetical protein
MFRRESVTRGPFSVHQVRSIPRFGAEAWGADTACTYSITAWTVRAVNSRFIAPLPVSWDVRPRGCRRSRDKS